MRAILWVFGLSILIMADEWIKEGYVIAPEDFLKPFTHESLLAALWLVFIVSAFLRKLKGKGKGKGKEGKK